MRGTHTIMTEAERFYSSPRWLALRKAILRRDKFMDRVEWRYGKRREANIVHHIFPREEYPEYAWAPWNLISVSMATHNRLHDRESNELTEAGKELLRRTARKNNVEIPERYREEKKKTPWKIGKSQRG